MIDNNMQITCTPSSYLRSYTHMQLKANKVIGFKNIYEMDCCIIATPKTSTLSLDWRISGRNSCESSYNRTPNATAPKQLSSTI